MLEWIAISFSRDLPDPGIEPGSPALQADALPSEPPGKPSISETVRCCFGALKSSSTSSLCLSAEKNSVRGTVIDKR